MDPGSLTGGFSIPALTHVGTPFLGGARLSSWFPEAASTHAENVDTAFFGLYVAAIFVVVLVVGLAVTYIRLFLRKDEAAKGAPAGRPSWWLQGVWVLGAIGLALFAMATGFGGFLDQTVPPVGAYTVDVTARQGDWDFTYPNGYVADTLHVAKGRPVKLTLHSADVAHALSVPALRLSAGILPDRQTEAWFETTVADTFPLQSAVFSGAGYDAMQSALVSHEPADFEQWLMTVSDIFAGRTLAEVGELLYTRQGCKACHSTDGSRLVGPSFQELYGHSFDTAEGVQITADDAYIRESILTPNASVIAGYEPVMTPYAGKITDKEIEAITAWLKTLSSLGGDAADEATATEQEGN